MHLGASALSAFALMFELADGEPSTPTQGPQPKITVDKSWQQCAFCKKLYHL
jgi:hypothetical protein